MTEHIWEQRYDLVIGGSDTPGEWYTHEIDVTGKVAVDAPCPSCDYKPLDLVEAGIVQCDECGNKYRMTFTLEIDDGRMATIGTLEPIEGDGE